MGQRADTLGNQAGETDPRVEPTLAPDDNADPEEIRAHIEQTRAEMSETLEAIQQRLTPEAIKDQAVDKVKDATDTAKEMAREAVREATQQVKDTVRAATIGRVEQMANYTNETVRHKGGGMLETIRQNPIPAALAAIGIGWLFFKGRGDNDYDYDERNWIDSRAQYQQTSRYYQGQPRRGMEYETHSGGGIGHIAHQAKETVTGVAGQAVGAVTGAAGAAADVVTGAASTAAGAVTGAASTAAGAVTGAAGTAKDTVTGVAGGTRDMAGNVGYMAQRRARRTAGGVERMLNENPLSVGALAMALGTAIGLAVPGTEQESRLMGDMRDNLVDQVATVAGDTLQKVQRVAEETASVVAREASTAVEEVKITAQQEAKNQGLTGGSQDTSGGGQGMMGGSQGTTGSRSGSEF